jgi:hypothetical protein
MARPACPERKLYGKANFISNWNYLIGKNFAFIK